MSPQENILVRVEHVSKRFGITQALDDVSVSFRAGEVHALMGENGAGKSTLGKSIAGLHRPDSGTIAVGGRQLKLGSIDDAWEAGVRIVHQELAQCPNLTVAENLCLHDMPTRMGMVEKRVMAERAARLVHRLDPGIDVLAPLETLPPGRRQIVQIASSLDDGSGTAHASAAKVIVFDEPTSSLSMAEADRLLEITRQLAAEGITIIYVSHRMGEIFACCDRVSVLRDGKYIATSVIKDIDEATLVEQMIGRRIDPAQRRSRPGDEAAALREAAGVEAGRANVRENGVLLKVVKMSSPGKLRDVSLSVAAGEILGVGGLVGAGRSELLDAIFNLDPASVGEVLVDGAALGRRNPRQAIEAGVGYVPEDRRLQGLFFELGIDENIVLPVMQYFARLVGVRSLDRERELVSERMQSFRVKAASSKSLPGELSGGNQQKLLIARWMGKRTRVLLLDEPTRGIDVGTKAEIYKLVRAAADAGAAVLLVSSEMPELLALSDRVVVLCEGRLTGELRGEEMTQSNILKLATAEEGGRRAAQAARV